MLKHWPFFAGAVMALVLIGVLGYVFVFSGQQSKKSADVDKVIKVEAPEIVLRPFFSFAPRDDGRAIQVSISDIADNMQIDYEITYTTGAGLEQGIGGPAAVEQG